MGGIIKMMSGKEDTINNNFVNYDELHYYKNIVPYPKLLIDLIENTDNDLDQTTPITKWSWSNPIEEGEPYLHPSHVFTQQKFIIKNVNFINYKLAKINAIVDRSIYKALKLYTNNSYELKHLAICKNRMGKILGQHIDCKNDIKLSVIVFLNNDYVGGEINFPEKNIEIKPDPGSALVYPQSQEYSHFSKIITSGPKYTINSFWG